VKTCKQRGDGIVPAHRKMPHLADQHQNAGENDGSDQAAQKNGATKRRVENDLTAAGLFSRIWLLIHPVAPSGVKI
jgi:hypothetical protein